jgi:hypothetical protein
MALINCPDCNKQVSSNAPTCPGCGAPIAIATTPKEGDFIPYTDQEVQVMLSRKKSTSHLLHLILSICTAGLWVVMWIIVARTNGADNADIDKLIKRGKKYKPLGTAKAAKRR